MRLCALLVIATACSNDPSLAVAVTHPMGLSVAKTTVTVYESETLRCSDIEFGELDDAGLAALQVTTVELAGSDGGGLSNISRTGNKIIVARGFDATGVLVSGGCVAKGEVLGDDTVEIATVVAVLVSVQPPTDASMGTLVSLTDSNGVALAEARPVSWTVYGPAGSSGANPANLAQIGDGVWEPSLPTCTSNGSATIHPNLPSTFGGYSVQVRAAWAVDQPQAYTSLTDLSFGLVSLGHPIPPLDHYCAIQSKAGAGHLVCILGLPNTVTTAYQYDVTTVNGKASVSEVGSQSTLTNVIAVVSEPTGTGTDRDVYAVTDHGVLMPLFGAAAIANTTPLFTAATANDALYVPACDLNTAKVIVTSTTSVKQMDAHGGSAQDLPGVGLTLISAGCVTQLQPSQGPQLVQLATAQNIVGETTVYLCSGNQCGPQSTPGLIRGAAIGFTGGNEQRVVLTTLDATGVVLVEYVLTSGNSFVERARLPTTTIPDRIIPTRADNDTGVDLFWTLVNRASSATTTTFEVAYARKVGPTNLEALSSSQPLDVKDMASGDLDGNGLDDVVVIAVSGVAIVPMGVTLPPTPANPDTPCMP